MRKTVVLNVVGLTGNLIGPHTPFLRELAQRSVVVPVGSVLPAVTTSVQATYLTGAWPTDHGIVGNGWYFRDECEVKFWRQSNRLVQRPKVWEKARAIDPSCTCANLFWWYNMYSSVNWSVTPRPVYTADGRKIPDIYTQPPELRDHLRSEMGEFPLFDFWGPRTSIRSSRWIAEAAIRVDRQYDPVLTLIYLPHLDYCLQRYGPDVEKVALDLRQVDEVAGMLVDYYRSRHSRVVVLSEYGITAVSRPVDINRVLRRAGLLAVREELGRELLDAGASRAFAVADHQIAHVYVNDRACLGEVRRLLEKTEGVAQVLDEEGKRLHRLNHDRAGELVALAERDAWFTYYYWLDDRRMPDFAPTVDIHRKPGYDPAELFIDPQLRWPALRMAWTLLKKRLGFRTLLRIIPTDGGLVRGSHGLPAASADEGPLLMAEDEKLDGGRMLAPTEVCDVILRQMTGA